MEILRLRALCYEVANSYHNASSLPGLRCGLRNAWQ